MSTSVSLMRTKIKTHYGSVKWNKKVDRMSDNQVTAIYLRLKYSLNGKL